MVMARPVLPMSSRVKGPWALGTSHTSFAWIADFLAWIVDFLAWVVNFLAWGHGRCFGEGGGVCPLGFWIVDLERTPSMSLVTAIRDYVDLVNSNYDAVPLNGSIQSWLMPLMVCVLEMLKQAVIYLFSFQWLRDLVYLPLVVPQLSLSALRENCYPLENPLINCFAFLEEPSYRDNKFFVGLLNSFFACLPVSAAHLLTGRRLLVQGVVAGIASGGGIVAGQCWLVVCVVLGLRPFLIPWLVWEPLNYILGIGLLVNLVYRLTHDRRIRVTRWTDRKEMAQYFLLSLVLTLCEQTSIFQYLGNLTVGAEPTALDIFSLSSGGGSLFTDGAYVGGFILGSILFALLFGWLALRLKHLWAVVWSTTNSRVTNWLNSFFLLSLVVFSFASIPYYGLDYLLTSKLGFLPNDTALDGTILSPTTMVDINQMLGRSSEFQSFGTDVSTFDRGQYGREDKPVIQSFEDLNYQGEYAWTRRLDKQIKHLTTRRAHPFWHRLLGAANQFELWGQPQGPVQQGQQRDGRPATKGFSIGSPGSPAVDGFDLQSSVQPTPPLEDGDGNMVAQLLDRRVEVSTELSEIAEAEREPGQPPSSERLEEDKDFEQQFAADFSSGLLRLFSVDDPPITPMARAIKRRYMANPLYSLLLRVDIDTFLGRQPASHLLSPAEESSLFQRRQMVSQYCDALRQYNQLQNWVEFEALEQGSKSFASRVYNQQFKGTLKVVRRLFSVALDNGARPSGQEGKELGSRRVLKLDQPLFERRPGQDGWHAHLHEELGPLAGEGAPTSLFLENANPKPLYAGWDEEMRKLVLTNRSLPRLKALHQTSQPNSPSSGREYGRFSGLLSKGVGFAFTAWPLSTEQLMEPKSQSTIPYQVAFELAQDPQNTSLAYGLELFAEKMGDEDGEWEFDTWPPNLGRIGNIANVVPPTRGGFLWPGHAQLRLGQKPVSMATPTMARGDQGGQGGVAK